MESKEKGSTYSEKLNYLLGIERYSRNLDYEKIEGVCRDILDEAVPEDSTAYGLAYFYLGATYYVKNDFDNMFDMMVNALVYLKRSKQWRLEARAYNLMAIISVTQGNTVAALEYYMLGLECCNEHNVGDVQRSIEINIGYLYLDTGMYKEARQYFLSAYARYMAAPENERDISRLTMIYTNLAESYMLEGEMDNTYVDSLCARFYHLIGDAEKRDMYIADLEKRLGGRVLIMDIFGDLYEFCLLMLELDRDDIVVEIINKIEEPIKKTRIANIKRKYLELKIRLYRRNNCEQKCIEAMNSFFDLSVQLEKDKQKMIATILRVRNSLDTIKERQKQLELET